LGIGLKLFCLNCSQSYKASTSWSSLPTLKQT
jgi:hypothetical protein